MSAPILTAVDIDLQVEDSLDLASRIGPPRCCGYSGLVWTISLKITIGDWNCYLTESGIDVSYPVDCVRVKTRISGDWTLCDASFIERLWTGPMMEVRLVCHDVREGIVDLQVPLSMWGRI
jgi:hypothetical protein